MTLQVRAEVSLYVLRGCGDQHNRWGIKLSSISVYTGVAPSGDRHQRWIDWPQQGLSARFECGPVEGLREPFLNGAVKGIAYHDLALEPTAARDFSGLMLDT